MRRKKIIAWTGGAIAAIILLILLGAYFVQQNTFVHRYLLAEMIQAGERAAGTDIRIGEYTIRWLPLQITLRDIVVRGRGNGLEAALATIPELVVRVSWDALLHKRVEITQLRVERPAINVVTNEAGESNLPIRSAPASGGSPSKLQITVQHATVEQGEVRYRNLPGSIDATLSDLHANVSHGAAAEEYSGDVGYAKGEIAIGRRAPLAHQTEIHFAVTSTGIQFPAIRIATALSQLNASGSMQGYSRPVVQAEYSANIATRDLHQQLQAAPLSGGAIQISGSASYNAAAGTVLQALTTQGRVASDSLRAAFSTVNASSAGGHNVEVELRSLQAMYSLKSGNLNVSDATADMMGGVVHAEFSAEGLTATPAYRVSVAADQLSLAQAQRTAGARLPGLEGTAQLRANAHWIANIKNAIAHADARVAAVVVPTSGNANEVNKGGAAAITGRLVPLDAVLHLTYNAPDSTLTVTNSSVTSTATNLVATGTISSKSTLSLRVQSSDLHETALVINAVRDRMSAAQPTSAATSTLLNLRGTASVEAQIQGRIQNPRIAGHVLADGLEIRGTRWPHVQSDFNAAASLAELKNGLVETPNGGRLSFALATMLNHWRYTANNGITAQLQASRVPVSQFEMLARSSLPLSGMVSANLSVHGTARNPAGEGSVEFQNGVVWGEPIQTIAAHISAADQTFAASFEIAAPAGKISGEGSFRIPDRYYQISIRQSTLNLAQIHYLSSRGYEVSGTLGIEAQGQGTLKAPQLNLTIDATELAVRRTPVGSIDAKVEVANQRANFTLKSNVEGGEIHATGNAGLTAPYMLNGNVEVHRLEFGPLLAMYAKSAPKELEGATELRGHIEGPLKYPEQVKANVELSTLSVSYKNLSVSSEGPVRLTYENDVLGISQAELRGTDTDFSFRGTVPLRGTEPMDVSTKGFIDLKLLSILGVNTQSSGSVEIDVTARGALKKPQIGGAIELANASFISDSLPIGVDKLNAKITVANNRLTVDSFSGQMGGGEFSVSGFATYAPVSFSLQVNGKSVRIRYPQGTRTQLDAELTFSGTPASSALNGRVTVDQLSFTPDFDLANFVAQFNSTGVSVPAAWEQNTRLNVAVASSNVLALSSSQLSLQGSVNLRVAGTIANPVVLGRTTLSGGSLIFMGNVYQVQSGTIVFANPIQTEPTLNLYVTTMVQDYDITLNFAGTLDRLRTNYTSNPTLPPVDIIHLLAFGTTTAQAAATATPASIGAESVIANGLASQVSNRIQKLTGISQLQIDPSLGGNNSDPGARIAIQQRIASNILFTFATDLTDTQNEVVQVKYQTKGRLSFSLTRDEFGSYQIQITTRKDF